MVSGLTVAERQLSLDVLAILSVIGLAVGIAGHADPLGVHGFIIFAASLVLIFIVIGRYYAPEPPVE